MQVITNRFHIELQVHRAKPDKTRPFEWKFEQTAPLTSLASV